MWNNCLYHTCVPILVCNYKTRVEYIVGFNGHYTQAFMVYSPFQLSFAFAKFMLISLNDSDRYQCVIKLCPAPSYRNTSQYIDSSINFLYMTVSVTRGNPSVMS